MNHYCYDEIPVGLMHSFDAVITEAMQEYFFEITGDCNPLHRDVAFAQAKGFSGRVVYGMLVSSFYSTLAGVYIPGEHSLIHSVDVKFIKPTLVGDKITIIGEVVEKNDTFRLLSIKASVRREDGTILSKAKMKVGVLDA